MAGPLTAFYLTPGEIHALAIAVAKGADPNGRPPEDAWEAAAVVWGKWRDVDPQVCALMTAFAEAVPPPT